MIVGPNGFEALLVDFAGVWTGELLLATRAQVNVDVFHDELDALLAVIFRPFRPAAHA